MADMELTTLCFGQSIYSQLPKKQILKHFLKRIPDPIFLSYHVLHGEN